MAEPIREQWVATAAVGKSFAEVGGLWGTVNEQVTVAAAAGATATTMIDVAPSDGREDHCRDPLHTALDDYGAWWWFFTRDYVAALLPIAGFEAETTASYWEDRATFYLARTAGPSPHAAT